MSQTTDTICPRFIVTAINPHENGAIIAAKRPNILLIPKYSAIRVGGAMFISKGFSDTYNPAKAIPLNTPTSPHNRGGSPKIGIKTAKIRKTSKIDTHVLSTIGAPYLSASFPHNIALGIPNNIPINRTNWTCCVGKPIVFTP